MEDMQDTQKGGHSLYLENREKATMTGILEVLAFDENQVILLTDAGEIALTGENLHVSRLMLEEGEMTVEGQFDHILYSERKEKRRLWRRNS